PFGAPFVPLDELPGLLNRHVEDLGHPPHVVLMTPGAILRDRRFPRQVDAEIAPLEALGRAEMAESPRHVLGVTTLNKALAIPMPCRLRGLEKRRLLLRIGKGLAIRLRRGDAERHQFARHVIAEPQDAPPSLIEVLVILQVGPTLRSLRSLDLSFHFAPRL